MLCCNSAILQPSGLERVSSLFIMIYNIWKTTTNCFDCDIERAFKFFLNMEGKASTREDGHRMQPRNLAAAADMMVKLAFRRQQTDKLKKEMFAAAAVGDYEAAAQLKKVITATESAMEEILSVAVFRPTDT